MSLLLPFILFMIYFILRFTFITFPHDHKHSVHPFFHISSRPAHIYCNLVSFTIHFTLPFHLSLHCHIAHICLLFPLLFPPVINIYSFCTFTQIFSFLTFSLLYPLLLIDLPVFFSYFHFFHLLFKFFFSLSYQSKNKIHAKVKGRRLSKDHAYWLTNSSCCGSNQWQRSLSNVTPRYNQ